MLARKSLNVDAVSALKDLLMQGFIHNYSIDLRGTATGKALNVMAQIDPIFVAEVLTAQRLKSIHETIQYTNPRHTRKIAMLKAKANKIALGVCEIGGSK